MDIGRRTFTVQQVAGKIIAHICLQCTRLAPCGNVQHAVVFERCRERLWLAAAGSAGVLQPLALLLSVHGTLI